MPLPNPFCGICKPKDGALVAVVVADSIIAFGFLYFVFIKLLFLSYHEKLETVSEILTGLFMLLGAIFNLVLQPMMICADDKKSLKGSLIWLILRVLADGICGFSFYYLVVQAEGGRVNGLAIILLTPVAIFHFYVWYVVLVFTQQLHLDAAAASRQRLADIPVEKGTITSSIVRQLLAKSEDQKNNNTTA